MRDLDAAAWLPAIADSDPSALQALSEAEVTLLEARKAPPLFLNEGMGAAAGVRPSDLVRVLREVSATHGSAYALDCWNEIRRGRRPGRLVLLFSGIAVAAAVELAPGVSLVPLSALDSAYFTRMYGRPRGRVTTVNGATADAALVSTLEIDSFVVSEVAPKAETDCLEKLMTMMSLLVLCWPATPVAAGYWWEPERPFSLSGVGYTLGHSVDVPAKWEPTFLGDDALADLRTLLGQWEHVSHDARVAFSVPLTRLSLAGRRYGYVDMAIELGIAMESLLLEDDDKAELSFRLAVHAAWLLGKDRDERREFFKIFRFLYGLRSSAVHRGELRGRCDARESTPPLFREKFMHEVLSEGRRLLVLVAKARISSPGKLDEKIFGEPEFRRGEGAGPSAS